MPAIKTNIPARLDSLPWCRFHVLIIVALGVTWILDGLEVTIVGSIGPVLQDPQTLALSAEQIGASASSYVVGAVCGALIFGWLTDRFGRRFVFYVTLIVYLTGVLLTAVSWNFWSFAAWRSRVWGSAANMPRLIRPSTSSFPQHIAAGSTIW